MQSDKPGAEESFQMFGEGARLQDDYDRIERLADQEVTRYLLRDPRMAALLSALVMGLGQLFNHQYKRAAVFFGGELAVFLYLWDYSAGLPVSQTLIGMTAPWVYHGFLWLLTLGGVGLWLYNVRDAYRMAEFCQFVYDRAFPLLDDEESEIVARHLSINQSGLSLHRGVSRKAVFLGAGLVLYSMALVGLGAFYLGRRDQVPPLEPPRPHMAFAPAPGESPPVSQPQADPGDPAARLASGERAFDAGALEAAQAEFEAVLSLGAPARLRYQALVSLGRVASLRGDDALASRRLLEAVELSRDLERESRREVPDEAIQRASRAIDDGEPQKAEKILAGRSKDWRSWLPLGRAAAAKRQWERSRQFLAAYIAGENPEPAGYLELARAESRVGRRQEALAHAQRYVDLAPSDAEGALLLASLLESDQGAAAAYAAIQRALTAHPAEPRLLAEAMQLAEAMGKREQALQAARALLKHAPGHPAARQLLESAGGTVLVQPRGARPMERPPSGSTSDGGRPGDSSRAAAEAAAPPTDAALYAGRSPAAGSASTASPLEGISAPAVPVERYAAALRDAELAFASGKLDEALRHYESVLSVHPAHHRSLFQKGLLLSRNRDRAGARKAFEAAAAAKPADVDTLSELGQLYLVQDELEKARETLDRLAAIDPRHLAARYSLAEIHEKQSRLAEAEKQYRSILTYYPELTEAHDYLGNLYYRTERLDEALEQFAQLLAKGGENPEVRFKIGLIYYRMNQPELALQHMRKARERVGPGDRIFGQVAKYLARLEQPQAARGR